MLIGVSVVVAVFSYFAYRHLFMIADSTTSAATSPSTTIAGTLFMWPFMASLLRVDQSNLADARRKDVGGGLGVGGAPSFMVPDIQTTTSDETEARLDSQRRESENSPETTPRARPVQPESTAIIPEISLGDSGAEEYAPPMIVVPASNDGANSEDSSSEDDDAPPMFPARNSAQRASGPRSSIAMPPPPLPRQSLAMPPPAIPNRNPRMQAPGSWNRIAPPSQAQQSRNLAVIGAGATGVAAGNGLTLPNRSGGTGKNRKVILEPGHSPLDWARLKKSGCDFRVWFSCARVRREFV